MHRSIAAGDPRPGSQVAAVPPLRSQAARARAPSRAPGRPDPMPPQRAFEEALGVARSDLAAVADEVGVIDVDVQSPGAPPAAGDRYDEALRSFMLAGEQLERAQRPADLVAVGAALERARYELACIRALLDGAGAPAHTAPCLFDPRHGPSTVEVQWSPGQTGARRPRRPGRRAAGPGLRGRCPAPGRRGGAGRPDRVARRPADPVLGRAGPLRAAARRLLRPLRRRPASVRSCCAARRSATRSRPTGSASEPRARVKSRPAHAGHRVGLTERTSRCCDLTLRPCGRAVAADR